MSGGSSLSGRALAARAAGGLAIEEGEGFRLLFRRGEFVLEAAGGGRWVERRRGGWLPDVLGMTFSDGVRLDGPAAVALPYSARCVDFDARMYRGERRPAGWSPPEVP